MNRRDADMQFDPEDIADVLDVVSDVFYVFTASGEFLYWNNAFAAVTGYSDAEIATMSPSEFVVPEDRDRIDRGVEQAFTEAGRMAVEVTIQTKDGETIPFELSGVVVRRDGTDMIAGVGRDISIRKERQAELELKNRAMDEAPVGVVITDPEQEDNPIIYANEGFERLTEYEADEIVGRNCRFLQGEGTDPEPVAEIREAIKAQEPVSVTLRNYRKGGSMFWNQTTIAPVEDDTGEVTHFVGFQLDVTDRKEYERELERQNDRLEEFANVVSHDLRNPLNVAQGRLDLAQEEVDNDNLEAVDRALTRMSAIIEDTLTLARQGRTVTSLESVAIRSLVERCWTMVEASKATLTVVDDFHLLCDADRLQHVFENLFRNAIEHGGEDVTVRVGLLDQHGFYVEDDGQGIPTDVRRRVFEPGYTSTTYGTGFGLSIVKRIAEAHGWEVNVTTSEEGGARFEFTDVELTT